MGTLKRYTKAVDGTIPVPALLYPDEEILASQDWVGIYEGWVYSNNPAQNCCGSDAGLILKDTHDVDYLAGIRRLRSTRPVPCMRLPIVSST